MSAPNLQALQQGDAEAWDAAFRWLWPTAFCAAKSKLQPFLPGQGESREKTFLVEGDLAAALRQADAYIRKLTPAELEQRSKARD